MFHVDVTWLGYFMALVSLYYVTLFLLSTRRAARRPPRFEPPLTMLLIVPAHNEELVISDTLETLVNLDYDHYRVLVVNDGSADDTGPSCPANWRSSAPVAASHRRTNLS